MIHAITHCPMTIATAHFPPSSRFTDAIAATHGVYSRQNTQSAAAPTVVKLSCKVAVLPNNTVSDETTLSLARNPEINAVTILQSPNPTGIKIGASAPATRARILCCESDTMFSPVSKFCKNQMTIVAMKITVYALC